MNIQPLLNSFFEAYPSLKICALHNSDTDNFEQSIKELKEWLKQECNGELKLISKAQNCKNDEISIRAGDFEYVVIFDILSICDDRLKLLQKCHKSLETVSNIMVISDKSNSLSLSDIKALLDEADFVAIGDIDIDQKYHIITAKKLYSWGK